ncbi:hypothetical protein [Prescottella equi]|uniref:hypothetical protein n=1 Tax=Rhodococcus hoagii TaxID=43767 RepID=UPI001EEAC17D|nr:hypothetical protein [Prescottella equi]
MNGAHHYAEAERLLKCSTSSTQAGLLIAQAQVHATLAQAAATLEASGRLSAWHADTAGDES